MIRLQSGKVTDIFSSGTDVVMAMDSGSITLKDAVGKNISVLYLNGSSSTYSLATKSM